MSLPTRTETTRKALPGHTGQTWGVRGVGQSIWEESSTPKHKLGTRLQMGCRVFYYAHASEALYKGSMASFNVRFNYDDPAPIAHPIRTTKIKIGTDATSGGFAKDQFAEGMLLVAEGTGEGDQYVIKSNDAIAASTEGYIYIYEPGLVTAFSATLSELCVATNPFYDLAETNSVQASGAGIPLIDITGDGYYFWLQTYGPAAVEVVTAAASGADGADEMAMMQDGTGMLVKCVAGGYPCAHSLGTAADSVETDADYGYVFLTCVA